MHNIAIFGGTFDPIHSGHLAVASSIQAHFHFDSFLFMPSRTPVHKGGCASAEDRVQMIKLALAAHPIPQASVSLIEVERKSPSYTVDTLKSFRKDPSRFSLTWILGWDAFASLSSWHQYEEILNLAHLLVIHRPESPTLPHEIQSLLDANRVDDTTVFKNHTHGKVFVFDAGCYEVSSSKIRRWISEGKKLNGVVPERVEVYIKNNHLY